jgi:hypothetical protein
MAEGRKLGRHFCAKLCPVIIVYKETVRTVVDGFGGLVVRMLASGSRVRGFKPDRSRWIFSVYKILSMPSFGTSQLCGM